MKFKIIADSSCDLDENYLKNLDIQFSVVPLTLNVGDREFVDDENLNVDEMLQAMKNANKQVSSACPSPQSFLDELVGADKYFIVTISSKLSGSFNSACLAKNSLNVAENVHVIDSKATSGSMILIIKKLVSLIQMDMPYEDICERIDAYTNNEIELLFSLNKYDNLIRSGRMSALKALIATTLNIKLLCKAEDGQIKLFKKFLGIKKTFKGIVTVLKEKIKNYLNKTCVISHCKNEKFATDLKEELLSNKIFEKVEVLQTKGLCSFYALEQGVIISYEL